MEKLKKAIDDYAIDKTWYYYLPVWLICLYIFYLIVQFNPDKASPLLAPIGAFDFWLHEGGHAVTMWLPPVVTASAGSLSEMLLGIILVVSAIKSRYYFTTLVASLWLAYGFKSAGLYMADARSQKLDLVSPFGDNAMHDWHFVFGKLHLLQLDTFIGGFIKFIGYAITCLIFIFCAWLIYKFAESAGQSDQETAQSITKKDTHQLYPTPTKGQFAPRYDQNESQEVYNNRQQP